MQIRLVKKQNRLPPSPQFAMGSIFTMETENWTGVYSSYCSIVLCSGARRHGGMVEQEEMVATKSGLSDKFSLLKLA